MSIGGQQIRGWFFQPHRTFNVKALVMHNSWGVALDSVGWTAPKGYMLQVPGKPRGKTTLTPNTAKPGEPYLRGGPVNSKSITSFWTAGRV